MKKFFAIIPKAYKISFFSLLGLISIASFFWKPIAIGYGKWLAARQDSPTGKMSVLLSGSNKRLESLIQLYVRDNVDAIDYAASIDAKRAELEEYREIFAKYNLTSDRLYCGELVESTFDKAQTFQRQLAEIEPLVNQIILVSDRYHLRRGIWSFEQVLDKNIEVIAYSSPSPPELADSQWWKHKNARKQVISEAKKLAFVQLYSGLLGRGKLITHGDINKIIQGKVTKGVDNPYQIV